MDVDHNMLWSTFGNTTRYHVEVLTPPTLRY